MTQGYIKNKELKQKSTGNEAFLLLICLNTTKFVLRSVFTLKETICPEHLGTTTAPECEKSTSG